MSFPFADNLSLKIKQEAVIRTTANKILQDTEGVSKKLKRRSLVECSKCRAKKMCFVTYFP